MRRSERKREKKIRNWEGSRVNKRKKTRERRGRWRRIKELKLSRKKKKIRKKIREKT